MEIVTGTYRQSAAQCGRKAAVELIGRRWWAFAIPLAAAMIASLWDWRWIAAAFALVLVAYPFVLMMAYYSRMLTPEGAKAILRRHLVISDAGIEVVYEPYDEDSTAPAPDRIGLDQIKGYENHGDSVTVKCVGTELSIPFSSLDKDSAADLLAFLSRYDANGAQ